MLGVWYQVLSMLVNNTDSSWKSFSWSVWNSTSRRMESQNGVAEGRQVAVFLSTIGGKNYTLLRNNVSPQKPSEKSLEDQFAALKRHYEPKRVAIAGSRLL